MNIGKTWFKKGHKNSVETRRKMSIARQKKYINEKNNNWKGDKAGYRALHIWVWKHKQKPEFCEECHRKRKLDLANKTGKYLRDIDDWRWLCRSCNMKDGIRRRNGLQN